MKVEKIMISVKKSRNFQTYEVGSEISLETPLEIGSEEWQAIVRKGQAACRKMVMGQIQLDSLPK